MYDIAENLTIRHPVLGDAQATLDLVIACEVADYGEPDTGLDDLLDLWSGVALDQDAWLVITPDNRLVGYAAIFRSDQRFTFDFYVHPTHAPDGLGKHLLARCEARAYQQLDENPGAQITASTFVAQVNLAGRQVAEELGFKPAKYHNIMRINFDAPPPLPAWPASITLRPMIPDQDDRLTYDFIQAAFDRPGRVRPSFEWWRDFMMGAYNFESDLWFLAYHEDELVGAALCFDYPPYGWVRQLGVAQAWRRQGIGSALLLHAFGVFHKRGHTTVGLGVQATNSNAYQLYENVGMTPVKQYIEYSKLLSNL